MAKPNISAPDPYAELTARLDKEVIDWKPETAGDRVAGTVVELTEVDGEHSRFPVVLLDVGKTLARVACGRSVLEREIRGRDVREGDALAIQYEGLKPNAAGTKNYNAYRVVHKPIGRDVAARVPSIHDNDEPPSDYLESEVF